MKKQLLFAFLAIAGTGLAQEPITGFYGYVNDDFGTSDGTGHRSYTRVASVAPLDQSAAGADLTWNFDQLSFIGVSEYHNVVPTAGETGQYPGTTRVVDNVVTINDVTTLSRAFFNGWAITGVENADFQLHYTDNGAFSTDMNLEYGDTYTETVGGTFFYDGYTGTFAGTITGTVDAYGTLNLNDFGSGVGATSDPVTRLKIVQTLTLSSPPFGVVGSTTFTNYHYYRQGDLYPFFTSTVSNFNIPLLSIDEEQTMMEVAAYALLATPEVSQRNISIVPNPTSGVITVTGDDIAVQSIAITDMNGRIVMHNSGANTIDISSLASGVYFARVATDSGSLIKKIVKQ